LQWLERNFEKKVMEKVTAEIAISKVEFYYLVNKLENVVKIYTYCSINFGIYARMIRRIDD
jgi:hypothetical protein